MKFSRLLVLLVPLFLAACGLSDQEKADYAAVQRSGVNPAIYDKMVHGDALSLYDIEALANARVNDGITLRYLRNTQTVYILSSSDVQALVKAGVSRSVVDYMLQTPQQYQPAAYPAVSIGVGPFWGPYPYGYGYGYPCRWGGGYRYWH
jgi:hypothetical protein